MQNFFKNFFLVTLALLFKKNRKKQLVWFFFYNSTGFPIYPEKVLLNYWKKIQIDVRPIVGGNFAKNEVIKYFDYEIHNNLKNSNVN